MENLESSPKSSLSSSNPDISPIGSHDNSPILKPSKATNKTDLLPCWFKEMNQKYDKFCEGLSKVQAGQQKLATDLKKFDERKIFLEKSRIANKKSISSLNYHLIFMIIRLTSDKKTGYLQTLLVFSRLNRHFNKMLDTEFIWRAVIEDYLGSDFLLKNHNISKNFYKINHEIYWKKSLQVIWEKFSMMKKSLILYKECNCPRKIEIRTLQRDLGGGLRFMIETGIIIINNNNNSKNRFFDLFWGFLKKEKAFYLIEMLIYTSNWFICSFTVDILILYANFDCEFSGKIREIIGKAKFYKQIEKLYRNHEQELQIRMAILFPELIIIPEILFYMKNKGINILLNELLAIRNIGNNIINKNLEKCEAFIYQKGNLEKLEGGAKICINKEGKLTVDAELRVFSGQCFFRNAEKIGKNSEVWRSFAVGRICGMGVDMGAYVGMVMLKNGDLMERRIWMYASDKTHDFAFFANLL